MKKLMLVSFALALVMSLFAPAQEYPQSGAMKQETPMAEKNVRESRHCLRHSRRDGTTLVDKDNKSWTVTNPEVLKGHEGHEVALTAHVDAAKNAVHAVSVKMGRAKVKDTTKKDEMKK